MNHPKAAIQEGSVRGLARVVSEGAEPKEPSGTSFGAFFELESRRFRLWPRDI